MASHPIGEKLRAMVLGALRDAPLPRCECLTSARDTWIYYRGLLRCWACFDAAVKTCALCERQLTLLTITYFMMELCRMGGSKRADVFVLAGCRDCASVPLGDWGIELLEWPDISAFAVVAKYTDRKVALCAS